MANGVNRFLGGSLLGVLVRLVLLSILIGVVLSVLGLDPRNIFESLRILVLTIWDMGFDTFEWIWHYFLLGAVIVIPIWLVVRLFQSARGR